MLSTLSAQLQTTVVYRQSRLTNWRTEVTKRDQSSKSVAVIQLRKVCCVPDYQQESKMSIMSPTNSLVSPMLTDMYQISMTYAHWKNKKVEQHAVFDLFFRTNPFHGEFCIFAGLDEVLRLLTTFRFSAEDVKYLQSLMPNCETEFFDWLLTLDCSKTKVYSLEEGSVRFCCHTSFPLFLLRSGNTSARLAR